MTSRLTAVSLTGADEAVDPADLQKLAGEHPLVEWALLYVPHAEGRPRNPGQAWRERFFETVTAPSAVHLCGRLAFEQLLGGTLPSELLRAGRLQLNINARGPDFSREDMLRVFERALDVSPAIILQYHADTAEVIESFLACQSQGDRARCHVLLDASRGLGQTPSSWSAPDTLPSDVLLGFAGGLGPTNMAQVHSQLEPLGRKYWMDMESGVRTDNAFDLAKCEAVLRAVGSRA